MRLEATCGCVKVVRERVLLPQRWRNGSVESSPSSWLVSYGTLALSCERVPPQLRGGWIGSPRCYSIVTPSLRAIPVGQAALRCLPPLS